MMARRRQERGELDEVAAHIRSKLVQWVGRLGDLPGCPWVRQLAAFDAGESILVHAWELPGPARRYGLDVNDRVWVDRFGNLALDDPQDVPPLHVIQPNPEES